MADEHKTFFLGKRCKRSNFLKIFSLYFSFLWICFEVCHKPKLNLMSHRILVEGLKMSNLTNEYKTIYWESEANVETLQKLSPYIWVSYKFVLKSVNSLNWIFLGTEYWFKTLKCQIWLTNTKPFFCEGEGNFKTLQNSSSYIWVSQKFAFKSVRSLNWILWATEYWLRALKWEIWLTNRKPFFYESEANVETLQKVSPYIWVSYKLILKSVNSLTRMFLAREYWFKALKCHI